MRAARQTVLPLWADHLRISAETTSLVFGVAGAVEMLMFYPAGRVMDTRGGSRSRCRRWWLSAGR